MTPEHRRASSIAPAAPRRACSLDVAAGGRFRSLLLAALLACIVSSGPADALRGADLSAGRAPAFQRVTLGRRARSSSTCSTTGPTTSPSRRWPWTMRSGRSRRSGGTTLGALWRRTTLTIPYPWVHGEAHVAADGHVDRRDLRSHDSAWRSTTPRPTLASLGMFALIGLYVGVLPVAIGLLWFPLVARLGARGLDFVLALTIGLLLFLLVDRAHEALESAALRSRAPIRVSSLLVFAAGGAYLVLEAFGQWLRRSRRTRRRPARLGHAGAAHRRRHRAAQLRRGAGHRRGVRPRRGRARHACSSSASRCTTRPRGWRSSRRSRGIRPPALGRRSGRSCCWASSAACRRSPARGLAASPIRRSGRCCSWRSASAPSRR